MVKWVELQNSNQIFPKNVYRSIQSIQDAQLKVSVAKQRITAWLKEDVKNKIFYFSGHGTNKYGGGICFSDGTLHYKDLAKLFEANVKSKEAIIMIIIDACFSGSIVDAFNHIKEDKFSVKIYFSSQKNQVSCDKGSDGGWFTQEYFGGSCDCAGGHNCQFKHFRLHRFIPTEMQHYSNGKSSPQQPGMWTNNSWCLE